MEFCEYKSLQPLLSELEDARQKADALTNEELEFVKRYVSRDSNHGQKKTIELLGISHKSQIRFIWNAEAFGLMKTCIVDYNKAQDQYKDFLDTSLNDSINLEDLQACLAQMQDRVSLLSGNSIFGCWWFGNDPKTRTSHKLCGTCRRRIVYETTKRDMTPQELDIEKETTQQKQRDHDKDREGREPQYYSCTSSFCIVRCSKCDGKEGQELFPRIIFTTQEKVATDWSICGCGRVALKIYNSN